MTELDKHISRLKTLSYHPSIEQQDAIDAVLAALEKAQKDTDATISFAYGNVAIHNPAITLEMVEQEHDKLRVGKSK